MALYPMYFQPLSPQQANPMLYGMQQGAQIAGQNQQNIARQMQNQLLSAQLPYAGQMAQADLGLKQAQVPYIQSQTALNVGTLPYLGVKFAAPYMLAQARMMQAGAEWSNNFRGWLGTPEGQQWMKDNPAAAQSAINTLNTTANINNNIGSMFSQPPPNANYTNPSSLPVLPGGAPSSAQQFNNVPGMTITPAQQSSLLNLKSPNSAPMTQQISNMQQAAADQYATKMMTPQQRQQVMYGNVVEGLLRDNQDTINNAIQFAGLAGKAGAAVDKYAQSAGLSSSQQYQDYKVFTSQIAPKIANELRRAYGGQATDYEGKLMSDIGNPIKWAQDPQQTAAEFNQLVSDLSTNARAITQTPSQSIQTANRYANAPISFSAKPTVSKVLNGTTYHKINGQWYAQ